MSFPVALNRMEARPLDASSFFTTLASAQTYAASSPNAYVGQLLTVVDQNGVGLYVIINTTGSILRIPNIDDLNIVADGLSEMGYKGSLKDMLDNNKETIKNGQIYIVDGEGLDALRNILSDNNVSDDFPGTLEIGDWLIVKPKSFDVNDLGKEDNQLSSIFGTWDMNRNSFRQEHRTLTSAELTFVLSNTGLTLHGFLGSPVLSVNGIIVPAANVSYANGILKLVNLTAGDVVSGDTVEVIGVCYN